MPGNWEMQDLDKDGLYNAKDWQCYQNRRTANNFAMALKLDGKGAFVDLAEIAREKELLASLDARLAEFEPRVKATADPAAAYATCPLPPPQNWMPLRIEAGELNYGTHR